MSKDVKKSNEEKKSDEKNITVIRLDSIHHEIGENKYTEPQTPDSEYVVDDSSFIPISEAIKQLGNGSNGIDKSQLQYDFPDGKDTGADIPFTRSSQFKDIAELSTEINNSQESIKSEIEKAETDKKMRDEIKKSLAPSSSSSEE